MNTLNGLPVYKMTIDETDTISGVEYISLVDRPAIQVDWVAMSNQKKLYFGDVDKQMLYGPAMIPGIPIYRVDPEIGEYYVEFTIDEIEKIFRKFNREQRTLGINYQHQTNSQVKSAVITEQWTIMDKQNDYSNTLGFDLPIGTKMVGVYISDKEFWDKEIKSGNVRGFSIEGFLNLEMREMFKNKLNRMKVKYNEVVTANGESIWIDGETAIDSYVYCKDKQTILINSTPSEIQYPYYGSIIELQDGNILTLENGKIVSIEKKQDTAMNKQKKFTVEVKTKEGVVVSTPADQLVEGAEVFITNEAGETIKLEDGSYTLDNGSVIEVSEGIVKSITEVETETDKKEEAMEVTPKYEFTAEDIQVIMEAIGMADVMKRLEDLENKSTQMSDKFSNLPGAKSITETNDPNEFAYRKKSTQDKFDAIVGLRQLRKK